MKLRIGIFDSGIGGFTILNSLLKTRSDLEVFYLADTKRVPYGNKNSLLIRSIAIEICNWFKDKNLDAILIGPYDLSASLGSPGNFNNQKFKTSIKQIRDKCKKFNKPVGIHVVEPSIKLLKARIREGFKFLPFGIDTVLLNKSLEIKF